MHASLGEGTESATSSLPRNCLFSTIMIEFVDYSKILFTLPTNSEDLSCLGDTKLFLASECCVEGASWLMASPLLRKLMIPPLSAESCASRFAISGEA